MISVIIPAYNAEKTIEFTVRSIINQGYDELEVIIVDDGSTDNTLSASIKMAEQDHRIHVIHSINQGVIAARLLGLSHSHGDYITFSDSDDYIAPGFYARIDELFGSTQADIICFGYIRQYHSGRTKNIVNKSIGSFARTEALTMLIKGIISPSLCDKAFKRELCVALQPFVTTLTNIKINEDLLMNYFLMQTSNTVIGMHESYYTWIERDNTATTRPLNEHRIYDPITVKRYIMDNAPESLKEIATARYIGTLLNTYGTLLLSGARQYAEDLKKVRSLLADYKAYRRISKMDNVKKWLILYAPLIYKVVIIGYRHYHHNDEFSEGGQ